MKIDKHNASHYIWGNGCDGWPLVDREGLSVKQERMPAGTTEARHYHRRAERLNLAEKNTGLWSPPNRGGHSVEKTHIHNI